MCFCEEKTKSISDIFFVISCDLYMNPEKIEKNLLQCKLCKSTLLKVMNVAVLSVIKMVVHKKMLTKTKFPLWAILVTLDFHSILY
jgi:hypothetical protein